MRYLVLLFLLFSNTVWAADITVHADRNRVQLNESFQLTFEASGSVDDDPDFSVLEKDFDVLSRSQSSNISIINGDFKRSTQWTLTLMPKQEGIVTVPSVAFGKDRSPTLRMTVKPEDRSVAGSNADQFIEVTASSRQAYVQQQLVVTVRMFSNVTPSQYGINELQLDGVDADVQQLGDDRQYRSQRGAKTYLVLERSYAVFPQRAGVLNIKSVLGEMQLGGGGSQLFDPFRRRGEVKRVRSAPLSIQVKNIPAAMNAANWLPANEVQLVEEWPDAKGGKPVFKVGDPVTRRLTLMADGRTAASLPPLTLQAPKDFRQYPEPPRLHDETKAGGIIGIREESTALIPTHPGRYTLPAIEVPWWNLKTDRMETARLPAQTITVTGTAAAADKATHAAPQTDGTSATTAMSAPAAAALPSPGTEPAGSAGFWPWLSGLLGVAWLLTLLAWWLSRRRPSAAIADTGGGQAPAMKPAQALAEVRNACRRHDAAACQQALLNWGQACFKPAPIRSLGELGRHCSPPLQQQISALEAALYGRGDETWNSTDIAELCAAQDCGGKPSAHTQAGLEPLYKKAS